MEMTHTFNYNRLRLTWNGLLRNQQLSLFVDTLEPVHFAPDGFLTWKELYEKS